MITLSLLTLLHVLVFVYWLGGDLGAFYTSRFLTKPGVSPDRRLMAAKIVGDVDMAPRTALILTLPTGLALSVAKGWLVIDWLWVVAAAVLSLIWLWLAWRLHLRHGAPGTLKTVDLAVRYAVCVLLVVGAVYGFLGGLPVFISLKLSLLALCIGTGLLIRRTLAPLGPALARLGAAGDHEQAEHELARTLQRARPQVAFIWISLMAAAFLGIWAPVSF